MSLRRFSENMMDACAEFWWSIYRDRPYVHRPDGYQTVNTDRVGPELFKRYLAEGLSGRFAPHWEGEVPPEGVILALDEENLAGILVCSVNCESRTGNILAAYIRRDARGDGIARLLVGEALDYFRTLGLDRAVAGPGTKTMEVECPIHLALLEAGFGWENNWERAVEGQDKQIVYAVPGYAVFLGGSLKGFRLQPDIKQKIEQLRREGITIEQRPPEQIADLCRLDTRSRDEGLEKGEASIAALADGCLVGWCWGPATFMEEGYLMGEAIPEVIPSYRRRGIGKVLFHLGIEELVRRGVQYGWIATGVCNPARLIYRSIGYRYWYTGFGEMAKSLR